MKIIFNRSSISAAVAPLMCAVSGKSTLSTIEGILIEAKIPDTCIMTTFDLEKGVRITVEAKVLEEGSYIINAQKFVQTLRVMEGEEVTLSVDQKMVACIFSGKSSHKMSALAGSDFPNIPELVSDRSFIIGQAVVKKMMNQVDFAMGIISMQTIGNDKLNQLRHLYFFEDADTVRAHMKKHAELLRPKFEAVLNIFERELAPAGVGSWTKPKGGYFISLDLPEGTATTTYNRAKALGVILTPVGATFPYGKDPHDSNLRIAPSFPAVKDLETAAEILCLCAKLTYIEKLLEQ